MVTLATTPTTSSQALALPTPRPPTHLSAVAVLGDSVWTDTRTEDLLAEYQDFWLCRTALAEFLTDFVRLGAADPRVSRARRLTLAQWKTAVRRCSTRSLALNSLYPGALDLLLSRPRSANIADYLGIPDARAERLVYEAVLELADHVVAVAADQGATRLDPVSRDVAPDPGLEDAVLADEWATRFGSRDTRVTELAASAAQGDERAFEQLWAGVETQVYEYVYRRLNAEFGPGQSDSEQIRRELLAEIRENCRREISAMQPREFGQWLSSHAVRRLRDYFGWRTFRRQVAVRYATTLRVESEHPLVRAVYQAGEQRLRDVLENFTDKPILREILLLRMRYRFSIEQTASWLEMPIQLVDSLENEAVRFFVEHFTDSVVPQSAPPEGRGGHVEISDQFVVDVLTTTEPKSEFADEERRDTITMLDVLLGADPTDLGLARIFQPSLPERPFQPYWMSETEWAKLWSQLRFRCEDRLGQWQQHSSERKSGARAEAAHPVLRTFSAERFRDLILAQYLSEDSGTEFLPLAQVLVDADPDVVKVALRALDIDQLRIVDRIFGWRPRADQEVVESFDPSADLRRAVILELVRLLAPWSSGQLAGDEARIAEADRRAWQVVFSGIDNDFLRRYAHLRFSVGESLAEIALDMGISVAAVEELAAGVQPELAARLPEALALHEQAAMALTAMLGTGVADPDRDHVEDWDSVVSALWHRSESHTALVDAESFARRWAVLPEAQRDAVAALYPEVVLAIDPIPGEANVSALERIVVGQRAAARWVRRFLTDFGVDGSSAPDELYAALQAARAANPVMFDLHTEDLLAPLWVPDRSGQIKPGLVAALWAQPGSRIAVQWRKWPAALAHVMRAIGTDAFQEIYAHYPQGIRSALGKAIARRRFDDQPPWSKGIVKEDIISVKSLAYIGIHRLYTELSGGAYPEPRERSAWIEVVSCAWNSRSGPWSGARWDDALARLAEIAPGQAEFLQQWLIDGQLPCEIGRARGLDATAVRELHRAAVAGMYGVLIGNPTAERVEASGRRPEWRRRQQRFGRAIRAWVESGSSALWLLGDLTGDSSLQSDLRERGKFELVTAESEKRTMGRARSYSSLDELVCWLESQGHSAAAVVTTGVPGDEVGDHYLLENDQGRIVMHPTTDVPAAVVPPRIRARPGVIEAIPVRPGGRMHHRADDLAKRDRDPVSRLEIIVDLGRPGPWTRAVRDKFLAAMRLGVDGVAVEIGTADDVEALARMSAWALTFGWRGAFVGHFVLTEGTDYRREAKKPIPRTDNPPRLEMRLLVKRTVGILESFEHRYRLGSSDREYSARIKELLSPNGQLVTLRQSNDDDPDRECWSGGQLIGLVTANPQSLREEMSRWAMELPAAAPVPYRIPGVSGVAAAPKSGAGGVGAALSLVAQRHPGASIDVAGAGPVMSLGELETRGRNRARHVLGPWAAAENLRDSAIGATTLLLGQHNGPIDRYGVATEPYVMTVADLGNGPEVTITEPGAAEPMPYDVWVQQPRAVTMWWEMCWNPDDSAELPAELFGPSRIRPISLIGPYRPVDGDLGNEDATVAAADEIDEVDTGVVDGLNARGEGRGPRYRDPHHRMEGPPDLSRLGNLGAVPRPDNRAPRRGPGTGGAPSNPLPSSRDPEPLLEQLLVLLPDRDWVHGLIETAPGALEAVPTSAETVRIVERWWEQLGDAGQAVMIERYPTLIGNLPGVPISVRYDVNFRQLCRKYAEVHAQYLEVQERSSIIQVELLARKSDLKSAIYSLRWNASSDSGRLPAPAGLVSYLSDDHGDLMVVLVGSLFAQSLTWYLPPNAATFLHLASGVHDMRRHIEATVLTALPTGRLLPLESDPTAAAVLLVDNRHRGSINPRSRLATGLIRYVDEIMAIRATSADPATMPKNYWLGWGAGAAVVHAALRRLDTANSAVCEKAILIDAGPAARLAFRRSDDVYLFSGVGRSRDPFGFSDNDSRILKPSQATISRIVGDRYPGVGVEPTGTEEVSFVEVSRLPGSDGVAEVFPPNYLVPMAVYQFGALIGRELRFEREIGMTGADEEELEEMVGGRLRPFGSYESVIEHLLELARSDRRRNPWDSPSALLLGQGAHGVGHLMCMTVDGDNIRISSAKSAMRMRSYRPDQLPRVEWLAAIVADAAGELTHPVSECAPMPRSEVLIGPDVTARRWPFPVRGSVLVVRPDPETDSGGDESTENAWRSPSEFEEIRRVLDAFFDPRDHDYVGPVTPADLETKYGIAVEEQEKIQNLLDRLGGCYQLAVWDSNPDAARLRAEGKCIPKLAGMYMKTLDRLDWILGAERQHLGKLGIYLPQLPMWLRSLVTPEQWSALEKRAELRRGEYFMWLNSPPPVPADVVIGPDNVLYMCNDDGEWLPVGSDIDGAEFKVLDGLGHELNPVDYDVAMLILNEMGLFQHGATAGWLARTPPEAAVKRQVLSKQTRMTVFRPGEPPRRERSPRPEEARSLGDLPTLTDTGLTSRAYLWLARTRPTDTTNKPTRRSPDALLGIAPPRAFGRPARLFSGHPPSRGDSETGTRSDGEQQNDGVSERDQAVEALRTALVRIAVPLRNALEAMRKVIIDSYGPNGAAGPAALRDTYTRDPDAVFLVAELMPEEDRERFQAFLAGNADTFPAYFAATVFTYLPSSTTLTVNARFAEHVVATLIDQFGHDQIRVVLRGYPADLRMMLELLVFGLARDAESEATVRSAIEEGSVWNNPFVHLFTDLTGGSTPSVDERTAWDEVCRNALDRTGKWRECLLELDEIDEEAVDFMAGWLFANRFPRELAQEWELETEEVRDLHHRAMVQMDRLFANWRPESERRNAELSAQPMTTGERALHRGEPIEVGWLSSGRSDAHRIMRFADNPGKSYLFTPLAARGEELPPAFAPLAMRDVGMHRVDHNLLGYGVTPVATPYYSSDSAAWGVLTELPAGALPPNLRAGGTTDPAPLARFLDPVYRQQMFVLFCLTRACGGLSMNMGADQRTPTFPYVPFIPADDGAEPRYAQWADFVQMGLRQPLLPEVLEPLLEIDPDEFAATLRQTVLPEGLAPPTEDEIADAVRLLEEIQDHGMVTGTAWPEVEQLIPTAVTDLPPAAELRTMAAHWRSQVDYDYPLGVLNAAELECYYGVTWELARDLQRAADIEGVVIGVRPMNPWATGQLRFGLTRPKPQSVKDKSSSNEDVALGRRPSLIGLVLAGEPMLPPVLPTDPAARNRLFTRYERRMSEWRAACARPDLTIDENQVVRLVGESEPVGPDTDLYELLLPPDMIPIDDPSTYERILTRLRLVHGLPVEHGALRQWDPKDAKGSELKLRLMEDHEPGGVPIVRFIPGEERAWAVSGVMADEGIAVGDMPPEVMAMPIGALAPGVRRP